MFETANILRRLELTGELPSAEAGFAHSALLDRRMTLWPYAPLAQSVWRLRGSITCYDATYVALAEHLDAPLVTHRSPLGPELWGHLPGPDTSVVFAVVGDARQCTVGATTRRTPAKPVDGAGRPRLEYRDAGNHDVWRGTMGTVTILPRSRPLRRAGLESMPDDGHVVAKHLHRAQRPFEVDVRPSGLVVD